MTRIDGYGQRSKYGAVRTYSELCGREFDSKAEMRRGEVLALMQRAGVIRNLEYQQRLPLEVNGELVAHYLPDFVYEDALTGVKTYEDVKSPATRKNPVYRLKVKLMWACWNIRVHETE